MNTIEELWKDIEGYEGIYQVSNYGKVRSIDRTDNRGHRLKGIILKPQKIKTGYFCVNLSKNGKTTMFLVHRLVAKAFIPNTNNGYEVDHIDRNRKNNDYNNLRWTDHLGNMNNKLTLEVFKKSNQRNESIHKKQSESLKQTWADSNKNKKLRDGKDKIKIPVCQYSKTNVLIKRWDCAYSAEKELNIKHSNIGECCRGIRRSAGGYIWKFMS